MNTVSQKAYAKLNITLDVLNKRPDGYHDMLMIMQTVSLSDNVTVKLNDSGKISARTNLHFIPNDERNLAVRAAQQFLHRIGREAQGMTIELDKHIPVGAGMAGGSSDAAAVLHALNRLFDMPLSQTGLERLSEEVGSDVPFCVRGGTVLASGRGEKMETLPKLPPCRFVICKPSFSISTPELFRKLDQISLRCHPDTAGVVDALKEQNLPELCRRMYNVFEDVDDRRLRTVSDIKSTLLDHGALGAVMTGTGSAVFGVFEHSADCAEVTEQLRKEYGFCVEAEPISYE